MKSGNGENGLVEVKNTKIYTQGVRSGDMVANAVAILIFSLITAIPRSGSQKWLLPILANSEYLKSCELAIAILCRLH